MLVVRAVAAKRIANDRAARQAERDTHVTALAKEYQAYLDETAQKITSLPVDPRVAGEIQTRHFQQRPALWLYIWATDNKGGFLFGVPSDGFARLNTAYDQNQAVIARDNHFANRDQFLRTFLHESRRIAPPREEGEGTRSPGDDGRRPGHSPAQDPDANWWRFYGESDEGGSWHDRSNVLFLSSPIQDASG